jgi:hypothetical protein
MATSTCSVANTHQIVSRHILRPDKAYCPWNLQRVNRAYGGDLALARLCTNIRAIQATSFNRQVVCEDGGAIGLCACEPTLRMHVCVCNCVRVLVIDVCMCL